MKCCSSSNSFISDSWSVGCFTFSLGY